MDGTFHYANGRVYGSLDMVASMMGRGISEFCRDQGVEFVDSATLETMRNSPGAHLAIAGPG